MITPSEMTESGRVSDLVKLVRVKSLCCFALSVRTGCSDRYELLERGRRSVCVILQIVLTYGQRCSKSSIGAQTASKSTHYGRTKGLKDLCRRVLTMVACKADNISPCVTNGYTRHARDRVS